MRTGSFTGEETPGQQAHHSSSLRPSQNQGATCSGSSEQKVAVPEIQAVARGVPHRGMVRRPRPRSPAPPTSVPVMRWDYYMPRATAWWLAMQQRDPRAVSQVGAVLDTAVKAVVEVVMKAVVETAVVAVEAVVEAQQVRPPEAPRTAGSLGPAPRWPDATPAGC